MTENTLWAIVVACVAAVIIAVVASWTINARAPQQDRYLKSWTKVYCWHGDTNCDTQKGTP